MSRPEASENTDNQPFVCYESFSRCNCPRNCLTCSCVWNYQQLAARMDRENQQLTARIDQQDVQMGNMAQAFQNMERENQQLTARIDQQDVQIGNMTQALQNKEEEIQQLKDQVQGQDHFQKMKFDEMEKRHAAKMKILEKDGEEKMKELQEIKTFAAQMKTEVQALRNEISESLG